MPISAFVFDILSYELTQPLIVTSQYSLFGQISLVLAFNAELNESTQLLSLDSLDLKSFIFDTLTNLATFFQVVKAVLLLYIRVHADLVTNSLCVRSEGTMSLLFKLALLILLFLLLLNYADEFVTFSSSLLGKVDLLFDELSAAGLVKLDSLSNSKFSLFFLFSAGFAFAFFECALGSKSIDLTLTISCTFLEFS